MAQTPSSMIPLGTKAPDFKLLDVRTNNFVTLGDVKSNIATVVMFICNHCPYVKHILKQLVEMTRIYQQKGMAFIAISSNDAEAYPHDAPEYMHQEAKNYQFSFPYLYDETQMVAKAYDAACTPDFFIFDHDLKCIYRGRFDDSTPGNQKPVTGFDLKKALDCILEKKPIDFPQQPSLGCNIKWRK